MPSLGIKKNFWVFDMDGTLTDALHDFPAIKRELGLPLDLDILTGLSLLDEATRLEKNRILNMIEMKIARQATPAKGVRQLLDHLKSEGANLGILTRNNYENTLATLETTGLLSYFQEESILTRDNALPKPDPEGLFKLQKHWNCAGEEMLMIGDYVYDLLAGKAANADTIYIDPTGEFKFKEHATYTITRMDQILELDLFF